MHHRAVLWALAWTLVVPGCTRRSASPSTGQPVVASMPTSPPATSATAEPMVPPPQPAQAPPPGPTASSPALVAPPATSAPSGLAALRDPATDARPVRGLSGGDSRSSVAPNVTTIASPPATLSVPPNAGVEATLQAVPAGIPAGHLTREALEGPLRDPTRFERCRKSGTTRINIDAVIYNGSALGVTVQTVPNDRLLNFCVERIVRATSWIKELAVNRVTVSL